MLLRGNYLVVFDIIRYGTSYRRKIEQVKVTSSTLQITLAPNNRDYIA